ncbi:hypothetical protein M5D96_003525 [Drosophila gunungcola]|uniref:Uncharacterized protein n=1 Tax=Drosophila gunungcola TaxID=103775 RepID=A0A9P9YSS6_9MUSC|nr:hypothetical protein M5D96_003525 [Drosophila gunungcola]
MTRSQRRRRSNWTDWGQVWSHVTTSRRAEAQSHSQSHGLSRSISQLSTTLTDGQESEESQPAEDKRRQRQMLFIKKQNISQCFGPNKWEVLFVPSHPDQVRSTVVRCGAVWCGPAKDQASTTKVGAVRGARRPAANFFDVRCQRAAKSLMSRMCTR